MDYRDEPYDDPGYEMSGLRAKNKQIFRFISILSIT